MLGSSPATVFRNVDLPAPFAPMMATVSPLVDDEADAEQRLEVAVEGGEVAGFEERHQARAHAFDARG